MRPTSYCSRCRQTKPRAEFWPNPKISTGLSSWCKDCQRASGRASREKYRERYNAKRRKPKQHRTCELCGKPFETTRPNKRFHSERCQRIAERRRYRGRRTESARCRRCGKAFTRTTTSDRLQVYCTKRCQRLHRSVLYRQRLDIQAGIRRAQQIGAWGPSSSASDPDRRGGALGICTDSGFRAEGG